MTINKQSYWKKILFFDDYFKSSVLKNRKYFYNYFLRNISFDKQSTVLDVGTTPSLDQHENFFIYSYPYKNNITCLSNVDCSAINQKFKYLKFLIKDAKNSNLKDNSFDIVHSNAVIEHVGNFNEQKKFLKECIRISKKQIFITTPYRFFPIEMHTKIPFIHFLPKNLFRNILKIFGENFFSHEKNLNLLSIKEVETMVNQLSIRNFKIIRHKYFFFISNLIIVINK